MKEHLLLFCETNDVFGNDQNAYQHKRCTTDNLLKLTETIFEGFQRDEHTAAAFPDVEKAFDCVWHQGLLYKLHQLEVPLATQRWITNFLRNREIYLQWNHCISEPFKPTAGVPQGSVISPILFNIYVAKPNHGNAQISQFADGTALYERSRDHTLAVTKLQKTLISW